MAPFAICLGVLVCKEMDKYLGHNRRVFVIAGAGHFLHMPGFAKDETKQIKETLNNNKFVIFSNLTHFQHDKLARYNPELVEQIFN